LEETKRHASILDERIHKMETESAEKDRFYETGQSRMETTIKELETAYEQNEAECESLQNRVAELTEQHAERVEELSFDLTQKTSELDDAQSLISSMAKDLEVITGEHDSVCISIFTYVYMCICMLLRPHTHTNNHVCVHSFECVMMKTLTSCLKKSASMNKQMQHLIRQLYVKTCSLLSSSSLMAPTDCICLLYLNPSCAL
jgi:hypothetical protein